MSSAIEKFRSDPVRVDEFRAILENPVTKEVLGIMMDDSPEAHPVGYGLSPTDTGIALGNCQGYRNYHEKLKAFGHMWPRKKEEPPPDYGAGDRPQNAEE